MRVLYFILAIIGIGSGVPLTQAVGVVVIFCLLGEQLRKKE